MVRDMPHIDRDFLDSSTGAMVMPSSSIFTVTSSGHVNSSSPFGTLHFDVLAIHGSRDLVRDSHRFFSNARHISNHSTLRRALATPRIRIRYRELRRRRSLREHCQSDITPFGVDRMTTPRPFATVGISLTAE